MGKQDYTGFTIHAGWIPGLLRGTPSKRFSSKTSGSALVKGYDKPFVEAMRGLSEERQGLLLAETYTKTILGGKLASAGLGMGGMFSGAGPLLGRVMGLAQMVGSVLVKKTTRAARFKDLLEEGSKYQARTKRMTIRGQHVWYLQGKTGPKELARAIIDNPIFDFSDGEKWYSKTTKKGGPKKHATWAQNALNIDNAGIDKVVSLRRVEQIGDAAEELIFKGKGQLKMEKPPSPEKGQAKDRDLKTSFGEAESTEMGMGDHHGLPEDTVKKYEEKYGKLTKDSEENWTKFMNDPVLKEWNNYAAKVLKSTKGDKEAAIEKVVITSADSMQAYGKTTNWIGRTTSKMNLEALRKMRHEFSIGDIREQSQEFGTKWKEGLPITDVRDKMGMRTYASNQITLDKNLKFTLQGVRFVTGLNHTLALAVTDKVMTSQAAAKFYIAQQQNHMHAKSNNIEGVKTIDGYTFQGYRKVDRSVNHKVNVSFSPKAGKEWLETVTKLIGEEIMEGAKQGSGEVSKKLLKKAQEQEAYGDIFWALPYISIEEGLWTA
jgi:hypothetical protein